MFTFLIAVALCAEAPVENKAAEVVDVQPLHRHPTLLAMLTRSNAIRRNVGLHPTRINLKLCQAAQNHANYMAATGDFSHYTNGGYQWRAHAYGFKGGVQENIAAGQGSVDHVFNVWQASGGHYAAIVGGYSEAGFGYAVSRNGGTYWVGVYGRPAQGDEPGEEEAGAVYQPAAEVQAAPVASAGSYGTMSHQRRGLLARIFRRR